MRGHLVKRAGNSWSIVLSLGYDAHGKRIRKWVTIKGTRRDAERRLTELLTHADNGTFVEGTKDTLGSFLQRWLTEYVEPNLSPLTTQGYQAIAHKYVTPALGRVPLKSLKPEHVQKYYADMLAAGLSTTTVRHHGSMLHRALKSAVQWGLLARNPSDAVTAPRMRQLEMKALNEAEVQRVLDASKDTPYYALWFLAIYTGMRRGELLALQWGDIDLLMAELSVNRSLHQLTDGRIVVKTPKTGRSRRRVALPPAACAVLEEQRQEQALLRLAQGTRVSDNDLVFCKPDSRHLLPNSVSHAWLKLMRRLGLKARFHDLRHTHATLMLKAGIHPKIVQERLGHSSISITLDTYSHVAPGLQQAAAARFEEVLGSKRVAEPQEAMKGE